MKKKSFLCLILVFLLSCCGCVTLQFEPGNTVVSPDNAYTQSVQQTDTLSTVVEQPAPQNSGNNRNEPAWSVSEIVSFLNTAVNKTKNVGSGFSMTENLQHTVSVEQLNSESLRSMVQSVTDKLNFSSQKQYLAAGGIATADNVSLAVQELLAPQEAVFALSEQQVLAAKVFAEDDKIKIAVLLQNDTATQQWVPALHGTKIPYLNLHGQSIAPYAIQEANIQYADIRIAAVVNAQGLIDSLTMSSTATGQATIGIGVLAAKVQFTADLKEVREYVHY